MDALIRHRLALLGLDPAAVEALPVDRRVEAVYRQFVRRVPYETLSRLHRWRDHPAEPRKWPRTTDRLLRENAAEGAGGTCFDLAYALAELFRGVGANAHTTLGRHLLKDEPHAAVLVHGDARPLLFEPTYFVPEGVPVRPGGAVRDALYAHALEPRGGPTLTMSQRGPDGRDLALYALVPVPAHPDDYRTAWIEACRRHRESDVVLARRKGDEVQRWFERDGRVEVTTRAGRRHESPGPDLTADLHARFGLSEALLRSHFAATSPT